MSGSPYYPIDYKNPGMRMWTRGDGSRYKDPGYIFIDRDLKPEDQPKWHKARAVEKFWKFLESKGARKIGDVSGEFGSDPHSPAVVLNKLIFVFNGRSIAWGSTSRLKNSSVWRQKQPGVAEGELATYLVSVMDSATGEHWRIEVKVTSPEMAKERAEAMGYKVLGVKEKGVAEGLSDTQKKIEDTILKLEQRLKFAKTPEQWDNIKDRIERLQAGLNRSKKGVAEGTDTNTFSDFHDWKEAVYARNADITQMGRAGQYTAIGSNGVIGKFDSNTNQGYINGQLGVAEDSVESWAGNPSDRRHPGHESYMTPEYMLAHYKKRLAQIAAGKHKYPKEVAQLQAKIAKLEKPGVAKGIGNK
jgi:hypothetical protein